MRQALELALEALEGWGKGFPDNWGDLDTEAITAMKEALAQPEQEPVAWIEHHKAGDNLVWDEPSKGTPLYTTPPQRKPLTDEAIAKEFYKFEAAGAWYQFARAVEAAHGIKE